MKIGSFINKLVILSLHIFIFFACKELNTQERLAVDQEKAQIQNFEGLKALGEGRWTDAENFFRSASELNPSSPEYAGNVGIAVINQGKSKDSLVYFVKAIEIDPNYAKGYYNLGVCYQNLGDLKQAIRNYETALKLVPTMIEARFNLGIVYAFAGDKKKAIENYEEFIRLAPKVQMETQINDARKKIQELK